MKHKNTIVLWSIFLLVLVMRLFIAFQTSEVTYDGYFALRNVENIKSTGLPLFQDDLSYSGRNNVFSPLFYYVLALFSFFVPEMFVLKVLPNFFAASTVFVVFLFAKRLSKSNTASLIAAGSSGVIPVFFSETINNVSIYSLVIPLFFLSLYFFLETVTDSRNLWKLIVCLVVLSLTHAASLILLFALLVYVLLINIQSFKKSIKESELLLFSLFLIIWANLTIYSRAIRMHGSSVIYQNTPLAIILDYFKEITFVESLFWIGTVPLLFGMITIYDSVFSSKRKSASALIAVCITFFLLLWFRLINLYVGLMFLGVSMSILSSWAISNTLTLAKNTKFKFLNSLTQILLVLLIVFSFIPSVSYSFNEASNVPSSADLEVFKWLHLNTDENATVLAFPEEGSALSYFSGRRNVIEQNFLLIQNIDTRYREVKAVYGDRFLIPALTKLNYYSVDYILLSEFAKKNYNVSGLFYEDDNCVTKVYFLNDSFAPEVFSVNCVVALRE